ncbi:tautomerase family protein [Comamonas testosteroni]|uniref:4-oxalocrotonate tautomerase-like domain-containing protein n=1 Tax=Comamonas testosteroni TaxID=285 RepID=A0A096HI27_COMTE|nr:tautomerase family protein [Comamonas testosteroni]KGH28517.1 hypothetical protein P353_15090 [Comamonas testosteroni]
MPIIQINLLEGRDAALVSECARQVAQTVHHTLGAPLDTIRVLVHEVPRTHWAIGAQTRQELDDTRAANASAGGQP